MVFQFQNLALMLLPSRPHTHRRTMASLVRRKTPIEVREKTKATENECQFPPLSFFLSTCLSENKTFVLISILCKLALQTCHLEAPLLS